MRFNGLEAKQQGTRNMEKSLVIAAFAGMREMASAVTVAEPGAVLRIDKVLERIVVHFLQPA